MTRKQLDFGLPLAVLLLLTALIAISGADLRIATLAYRPEGWPIGGVQPWRFFYLYGYYPAYILGSVALGLFAASFIKPKLAGFRKGSAFMVILLALGPGLLVNTVFKGHWGRERPHEMTRFGGSKAYQQPWDRGETGSGRSFPSGHAAAAFYLAMPYFVLRQRKPRVAIWVYSGGMLYSILMGIARIVQGGHFVSDILWAWGVVHLTAVTLSYVMGLNSEESPHARM